MKILISGSSGLVGSALIDSLRAEGHSIARLVRSGSPSQSGPAAENIRWEPPTGSMDIAGMEAADAVVHLAGASIAEGRWTPARKQILRRSRVDATRHLIAGLAQLKQKPRVLVAASAVGYYGDRGDETLTESSASGDDFLAQICRDWESETAQAERIGIRTVMLRFGIILAAKGGALKRILVPFRLGVGGRLGTGRQWMSWITLDEVAAVIQYAIKNDSLRGPVNAVSPNPVTNSEFTSVLAGVLHRPALFPAPRAVLRFALGEMADALLFSSQRVAPQKLQSHLYPFRHPELKEALLSVLK
ncbi:MAG TPA: TIGR01777 family oxidoreductase [Candidatus Limnocylindrales bacterium]|nr:TIGR01777 family oxidoreductase [Candidatus Limnocylindrales bacterium]